jgi:hypothetical protein
MGTTVVGGMMLDTALGIFVIPCLFVVVEEFTEWLKSRRKHQNSSETLTPPDQPQPYQD